MKAPVKGPNPSPLSGAKKGSIPGAGARSTGILKTPVKPIGTMSPKNNFKRGKVNLITPKPSGNNPHT